MSNKIKICLGLLAAGEALLLGGLIRYRQALGASVIVPDRKEEERFKEATSLCGAEDATRQFVVYDEFGELFEELGNVFYDPIVDKVVLPEGMNSLLQGIVALIIIDEGESNNAWDAPYDTSEQMAIRNAIMTDSRMSLEFVEEMLLDVSLPEVKTTIERLIDVPFDVLENESTNSEVIRQFAEDLQIFSALYLKKLGRPLPYSPFCVGEDIPRGGGDILVR